MQARKCKGFFKSPLLLTGDIDELKTTIKEGRDRGKGPMQIGFVFCRDYVKTYILRFPVLSLDYSVKKNAREQVLLVITLGKASRIFYRVPKNLVSLMEISDLRLPNIAWVSWK